MKLSTCLYIWWIIHLLSSLGTSFAFGALDKIAIQSQAPPINLHGLSVLKQKANGYDTLSINAAYQLALIYYYGVESVVEKDEKKAMQYFEHCATTNHVDSIINLSFLYIKKGDFDKAFDILIRVLETDTTGYVKYILGLLLYEGSCSFFHLSHSNAYNSIVKPSYLLSGSELTDDRDIAFQFFKECSNLVPDCFTYQGLLLEYGGSVLAPDFQGALHSYKTGCDLGAVSCCYFLSLMYIYGRGVSVKQFSLGASLLLNNVRLHQHAPSMVMLGKLHVNGLGVEKDYYLARDYFRQAIETQDLTCNDDAVSSFDEVDLVIQEAERNANKTVQKLTAKKTFSETQYETFFDGSGGIVDEENEE
jgi:TPR repeat protein